jgi:hypothetical protein
MSKSIRNVLNLMLAAVGTMVGTIIAAALLLTGLFGVGLATGRAADLLQGAQPRLLSDWTVALDGWALLFAVYILLWIPLTAVIRAIRSDPKAGLGAGNDTEIDEEPD